FPPQGRQARPPDQRQRRSEDGPHGDEEAVGRGGRAFLPGSFSGKRNATPRKDNDPPPVLPPSGGRHPGGLAYNGPGNRSCVRDRSSLSNSHHAVPPARRGEDRWGVVVLAEKALEARTGDFPSQTLDRYARVTRAISPAKSTKCRIFRF